MSCAPASRCSEPAFNWMPPWPAGVTGGSPSCIASWPRDRRWWCQSKSMDSCSAYSASATLSLAGHTRAATSPPPCASRRRWRTCSHRPARLMAHSDYAPQLATLVKEAPPGDEWLHEIKFDGYRIGCRMAGGRVALISRNGKDWTAAFPEIAAAARKLAVKDALIDGEVAIVLPDGRTSFQALQNAASGEASRTSLVYFV